VVLKKEKQKIFERYNSRFLLGDSIVLIVFKFLLLKKGIVIVLIQYLSIITASYVEVLKQ